MIAAALPSYATITDLSCLLCARTAATLRTQGGRTAISLKRPEYRDNIRHLRCPDCSGRLYLAEAAQVYSRPRMTPEQFHALPIEQTRRGRRPGTIPHLKLCPDCRIRTTRIRNARCRECWKAARAGEQQR